MSVPCNTDGNFIDLTENPSDYKNPSSSSVQPVDLVGFDSNSDDEIILPIRPTNKNNNTNLHSHTDNILVSDIDYCNTNDVSFALAQQLQYEEMANAQQHQHNNNRDNSTGIIPVPHDYTPFDTMKQYKLDFDELELIDPNPDIYSMFHEYNNLLFGSELSSVELKWSKRATLCAGLCYYQGRGGLCSIRLSEPLLKLRPRSDLLNTLLHEMIHAYLFMRIGERDHNGHGNLFQYHMKRINHVLGTSITIYHTFHEEVRLYKTHHWRCNGVCKDKPPFYGWVKRSMNRARMYCHISE